MTETEILNKMRELLNQVEPQKEGKVQVWMTEEEHRRWLQNMSRTEPIILMVTEDGEKMIGKDEIVWGVVEEDWGKLSWTVNDVLHNLNNGVSIKWFSSAQKMNDYILYNKPLFSIQDIEDRVTGKGGVIIERMKKLAQEKLKQQ